MRRLSRRAVVMLLAGAVLVAATPRSHLAAQSADIAVVVHSDVAIDNLPLTELRRMLLGDREFWPSGVRVTLLLRAPIAKERDVAVQHVCEMTEAQFRQHWIAKVFRAETPNSPKIVYSGEMALDQVSRVPGALTFVEASAVGRGLKVLKIDGKLPGQPGYPLK
jgi:hypothetical protein